MVYFDVYLACCLGIRLVFRFVTPTVAENKPAMSWFLGFGWLAKWKVMGYLAGVVWLKTRF